MKESGTPAVRRFSDASLRATGDAIPDRTDAGAAAGRPAARRRDAELPMRGSRGIVRGVVLLFAIAVVAVVVGFVVFAEKVADAAPPANPHAEGIVVLTGGADRIDGALRLLAEGRAKRLLISGVNPAVSPRDLAGTVDAELNAVLACCVDLGHEARDTSGNATETRDWAAGLGYTSLIVVTSAYHMPRSLAELGDAMPGVKLTPYPIAGPGLHLADWWSDPEAFGLLVREYGKYLLASARLVLSPAGAARS